MKALSVFSLLATLLALRVTAQQPAPTPRPKPCRQHPQLSGPCYPVHGALRSYNGTPSFRIWRIGTHRVLGISEGRFKLQGYCNLPKWLEGRVRPDSQVIGDFVVCPFTADEPGVMRLVCVDSAYNLRVRPWR